MITIHEPGNLADKLQVVSYGNGTSYAFHFGEAGSPMRTLFFQDNDALALRAEYDALETNEPETECRDHWLSVLAPYL